MHLRFRITEPTSDDVSDSTLANLHKSQLWVKDCYLDCHGAGPNDWRWRSCCVSSFFHFFFLSISSMAPLEHAKNIYPKLAEPAELLHISPHSPHLSFFQPSPFLAALSSLICWVSWARCSMMFLVCPSQSPISPRYRATMSSRRLFISSIISDWTCDKADDFA